MTVRLADVSPVVRDALALIRHNARRPDCWWGFGRPEGIDPSTALFHVRDRCRTRGPEVFARRLGLRAYLPDPPLELP